VRTGFREHILAGAFLFIAVLALLPMPVGVELLLAGALFIAGGVMPDLDSSSSKPRRFARFLALVAVISVLFFAYPLLSEGCNAVAGSACIYMPLALAFLAVGAVYALDSLVPKHRGVMHCFSAALVYGAGVFLLTLYIGVGSSFILGAWAFGGYLSHILVDFMGDAIPFK
jgi:inner membrane protein